MAGESVNDKLSAAYAVTDQETPAGGVRIIGTVTTTGGGSSSPVVQPVSITSGFPVVQPVSITSGFPVTQPVSIADGSDVTEGLTTDAAVITDANGTVSAKLRGLIKIWADVWDPINHWIKISISSSSIIQPVSITSGIPIIQPVSITSGFPITQPVSITTGFPSIQPVSITSGFPVQQRVSLSDGTTTAAIIASIQSLKSDLASVAGTVTETARAGVQRVGLLGATGVALDAATGVAVPQNALMMGGRAATSNPNASTNALMVQPMYDKVGRQIIREGHVREMIGVQTTRVTGNSETTIVTTGGLGVFNDISALTLSTTFTTVGTITVKDSTAGTTRMVLNYPPSNAAPQPLQLFWQPQFPQGTGNSNWTVTQSSSTMAVTYNVVFIKNI